MLVLKQLAILVIILFIAYCCNAHQDNSIDEKNDHERLLAPLPPISILDLIRMKGNLLKRPAVKTLFAIKLNIFGIPTDLSEVYNVGTYVLELIIQAMTFWIYKNTKDSDPYATRDTLDELTAKVRVNEMNQLLNNIEFAVNNYVANEQLRT